MTPALIPLRDINPFDATHVRIGDPPGFCAVDKTPHEHLLGAEYCQRLLLVGATIRPIAIVASDRVPAHLRAAEPWQRIDGFKRYWGHRLAGKIEIACVIFDDYLPGCQHGLSMEIA